MLRLSEGLGARVWMRGTLLRAWPCLGIKQPEGRRSSRHRSGSRAEAFIDGLSSTAHRAPAISQAQVFETKRRRFSSPCVR